MNSYGDKEWIWPAYIPPSLDYRARKRDMQRVQIAKGGAHLAQLLGALEAQIS